MSSENRHRKKSGSSHRKRSSKSDEGVRSESSFFQFLGQVVLTLIVISAPWAFAGVPTVVQFWLVVGSLIGISVWWLHVGIVGLNVVRIPLAMLPLATGLVLAATQLVPLNNSVAELLSPKQVELRKQLNASHEGGTASSTTNNPVKNTISLNPSATKHDLALLALGATVFVLASQFFKRRISFLFFQLIVAINGSAFVLFAIVQRLTWDSKFYWFWETSYGERVFGTFVNENNAGGYLNLCLACAFGFTIWLFSKSVETDKKSSKRGAKKRPFAEELSIGIRRFVAELNARKLALVSLCGCLVGGVLCTFSRGAIMSTAIALVTTLLVVLMTRKRGAGVWGLALVLALGLGLTSWVGMTEPLTKELSTLENPELQIKDRMDLWTDVSRGFPDFWKLGSGLGTFRHVYRGYLSERDHRWFYHAENQFVEAGMELGLPGFLLLVSTILVVFRSCLYLLRHGKTSRDLAIGVTGVFGLTSQIVQSQFDFGLYMPANMILLATICGGVCIQAHLIRVEKNKKGVVKQSKFHSCYAFVLIFILFGGSILGAKVLNQRAAADLTSDRVRDLFRQDEISIAEVDKLIKEFEPMVRNANDADAYRQLAELWLARYQTVARDQLHRAKSSDIAKLDPRLAKEVTSIREFHRLAYEFKFENLDDRLTAMLDSRLVVENLVNANYYLRKSHELCPMLPGVYLRMAELSAVAGGIEDDYALLNQMQLLAPTQSALLKDAGFLDLQARRYDSA